MAAAALEQSMLESKDKDTLLEMAKALGVKVTARQKKSDIIDKILETTGPSSSSTPATEPPSGNGRSTPASTVVDERDGAETASSTPSSTPSTDTAEVVLGPDGEPLADWEIELARSGESAEAGDSTPGSDQHRNVQNRTDQHRGERSGGGQNRGDQNRGDQNRGDQNRSDQHRGERSGGDQGERNRSAQGGGQRTDNRNNENRANEAGDGNRRRRRRRKGRGGQEGPQGEDVELIELDSGFESTEPVDVEGYLDIRDEGYGFLRVNGYLPSKSDAYIPLKLARQYGLRKGDHITGKVRPAGRNEKNPGLLEIYTINGGNPEAAKNRPHFESLTALFPDQRLTLEDP
ncbi:MAG: Rho termination factor N-terminal domain-containing protein, partial [Acidobacteriota bacterium]